MSPEPTGPPTCKLLQVVAPDTALRRAGHSCAACRGSGAPRRSAAERVAAWVEGERDRGDSMNAADEGRRARRARRVRGARATLSGIVRARSSSSKLRSTNKAAADPGNLSRSARIFSVFSFFFWLWTARSWGEGVGCGVGEETYYGVITRSRCAQSLILLLDRVSLLLRSSTAGYAPPVRALFRRGVGMSLAVRARRQAPNISVKPSG